MAKPTAGSVVKVTLAVLFFPFVAFLVLVIGIGSKNKRVLIEGAVYAGLFVVAFSVPDDSPLQSASGIIGLGTIAVAAVRSYMLRDLWLNTRERKLQPAATAQPNAFSYTNPQPAPVAAATVASADNLSSALTWVTAHAKQNKHRLSTEAYVMLLETCQTLDAVIDAENRQPSGDARFEYELDAIVRQYLPAVLKGYLAIPPSMVDDRQPNGRTPNQELTEQLQLLSGQADALHSSRHGQTSAELTSTGNFLRERFGHHQRDGFDFGIERN